jgi:hypothetical protein
VDNTRYENGVMKEYVIARHLVDMAWECRNDWLTDEMRENPDWVIADIVQHGIDTDLDNVSDELETADSVLKEDEYDEYLDAIKWCYVGVMVERIANNGGMV